jgi:hypothetical protein
MAIWLIAAIFIGFFKRAFALRDKLRELLMPWVCENWHKPSSCVACYQIEFTHNLRIFDLTKPLASL